MPSKDIDKNKNKNAKTLKMFSKKPQHKTRRQTPMSTNGNGHPGKEGWDAVQKLIATGKFVPYIPEPDEEYIQRNIDLIVANLVQIGKIPILYGNQGTGKSKLVLELAAKVGMPYFSFPVDGSIALQEVYGEKTIEGDKLMEGRFTYTEKLFLLYLQIPCFICIEELPAIDPSFGFSFHDLFQNRTVYVHDAGKIYHQHPDCVIICTGNYSTFAGVSPINPALADRMEFVEVPMLSIDDVKVEGQYASNVKNFLKKLHVILDESNSKFKISFRRVDTYNKLITQTQLPHAEVVKVCFLNPIRYMEAPEVLDKVWAIAKAEFGLDKSVHAQR